MEPSRTEWEDIKWMATINVAEREDGGMRVWSDEINGLILSGPDAAKVGAAILPAIKVIREYQQRSEAGRKGGLAAAKTKAARRAVVGE